MNAPILRYIGALVAAVPCFVLSWTLFSVWANPMAWDGGTWVRFGLGLMLLEFILLHSGAFMGAALSITPLKKRLGAYALMGLFYGGIAWGFSVSLDSPGVLWIFGAVVAGRLISAFTEREAGRGAIMARSAIGIVFYIVICFASIFVPVPEWGITPAVVEDVYPNRGGGIWEQDPERAIAGAAVYFLLMGLAELFVLAPKAAGAGVGASWVKGTSGDS